METKKVIHRLIKPCILAILLFTNIQGRYPVDRNLLCKSDCENIVKNLGPIEIRNIPLVYGDCEVNGHRPRFYGTVNVSLEGSYLVLDYSVTIREDRPDYTTFSKKGTKRILIKELASAGCEFAGLNYDYGSFEGQAGENVHEPITVDGDGLIKVATVLTDTPGKDCGKLYATLELNPVVVKFK